ncbi:hypothetical protein [Dyadobacter frigoris]|uniref:Uncharacterized protein n=1 Tax=Dyadobacter frigoris TaxID=2576211 RepID=A0A4U6D912_9BACT|nr:hypothetical protein [Dyadobacter frigoris]TKT92861.1 hypothetical protein FDK13_08715 [Dyadobacter frigoris]
MKPVYSNQQELIGEGEEVSVDSFRERWLGQNAKSVTLLDVFRRHNDQIERLIGKGYAAATLLKCKTSLKYTCDFIQWKEVWNKRHKTEQVESRVYLRV